MADNLSPVAVDDKPGGCNTQQIVDASIALQHTSSTVIPDSALTLDMHRISPQCGGNSRRWCWGGKHSRIVPYYKRVWSITRRKIIIIIIIKSYTGYIKM